VLIPDKLDALVVWSTQAIAKRLHPQLTGAALKAIERSIQNSSIQFETLNDRGVSLVD